MLNKSTVWFATLAVCSLACIAPAQAAPRDLSAILESGTLNICVRSDIPPFGFYKGKKAVGFDIDLARALARHIQKANKKKLKVVWHMTVAKKRVQNLQFGVCDFVAATFSITPERSKVVSFSQPYLQTQKVVLARRKVENPKPVLALIQGTTAQGQMALGVNRYFKNYLAAIAAMKRGKVDFMVVDQPIANYITKRISKAFYITQRLEDRETYGIGIRKDSAQLQKAINDALAALKANGTMKKLRQKWL